MLYINVRYLLQLPVYEMKRFSCFCIRILLLKNQSDGFLFFKIYVQHMILTLAFSNVQINEVLILLVL